MNVINKLIPLHPSCSGLITPVFSGRHEILTDQAKPSRLGVPAFVLAPGLHLSFFICSQNSQMSPPLQHIVIIQQAARDDSVA